MTGPISVTPGILGRRGPTLPDQPPGKAKEACPPRNETQGECCVLFNSSSVAPHSFKKWCYSLYSLEFTCFFCVLFTRGERPERSGRDVSGHSVRGAPPGSRSNASGYGGRDGDRGVISERGSGAQVSVLSSLQVNVLTQTMYTGITMM